MTKGGSPCLALPTGKAAIIVRNGRIVRTLEGRGVKPLLDALAEDPDVFAGAEVIDRIVGRAAAAIYVYGRAARVVSPVMSEGAVAMLSAHGTAYEAGEVVPFIVNRAGTGCCPMDAATQDMSDPAEIVRKLVEQVEQEGKENG